MLRPITADDRETYIAFAKAFYASEAVCHAISEKNICDAFESFVDGNPFAECYIVTDNGESAGYVLCAKTYSQEAGGMTMISRWAIFIWWDCARSTEGRASEAPR